MGDCTRASECDSVCFCSYGFIVYLICLCTVDVHRTCTTLSFSAGNCKSRSIEEVNMQNLLQFTRLFRDALYDNIEAFCCFSKANRLVLSLFFPSCARPLSAFDWQSCRSRGRRYRWNEGNKGNKMQNKEQREQEHCSDLKLVYVCSQFRMLSSLNCRVVFFFTTPRPECQRSCTKPHRLHLNATYCTRDNAMYTDQICPCSGLCFHSARAF